MTYLRRCLEELRSGVRGPVPDGCANLHGDAGPAPQSDPPSPAGERQVGPQQQSPEPRPEPGQG